MVVGYNGVLFQDVLDQLQHTKVWSIINRLHPWGIAVRPQVHKKKGRQNVWSTIIIKPSDPYAKSSKSIGAREKANCLLYIGPISIETTLLGIRLRFSFTHKRQPLYQTVQSLKTTLRRRNSASCRQFRIVLLLYLCSGLHHPFRGKWSRTKFA